MTDSTPDLRERLVALLARETGEPTVSVTDLQRLPAGASRHTWSFRLARGDAEQRDLILRLDAPGGVEAEAMGREAALMAAAAEAGVPSPEVVATSTTEDDLGAAYVVMSRVEGESIPRRILRDPALAATRPRLAGDCGRALARIHRIPPEQVPGLEARDELAHWRDQLDESGQAHPAFELAIRWLEDHRPPEVPPVVVHGDFRNGNLIVGPDGIRAVLDWELAHLGAPLEDLGWLCVKAWRFGASAEVGGFGTVDDLVGAYEAESGTTVDLDELRWWTMLGTLKWGVICIHQAQRHRSGAARSVELAAIGRRVAEVEWDLLQLLP
jgi:aminoglycoside phosphotransferase (APT) family kinase protein